MGMKNKVRTKEDKEILKNVKEALDSHTPMYIIIDNPVTHMTRRINCGLTTAHLLGVIEFTKLSVIAQVPVLNRKEELSRADYNGTEGLDD